MNKLFYIKTKQRAFSLIDVIFALLFVFIMLILGLKLIFTSNQIEDDTDVIENITNIIANQIELYNQYPELCRKNNLVLYDEDFNELIKDTEENRNKIRYRKSINVEELKDNLHLMKFKFYDVKKEEVIFRYEAKIYIPKAKRSVL